MNWAVAYKDVTGRMGEVARFITKADAEVCLDPLAARFPDNSAGLEVRRAVK